MKTSQNFKLTFLAIGTILFSYLFWKQGLGINFGIFEIFIATSVIIFYKDFYKSKTTLLTFAGTVITSLMIIIYGSVLASVIFIFSVILLIGYIHQPQLKLSLFSLISSIVDYFSIGKGLKSEIKINQDRKRNFSKIGRFIKTALIPIFVLIIFYIIFKNANPVFEKFSDKIFQNINDLFSEIFKNISFGRIIFTLWGLSVIAWIIFNSKNNFFSEFEKQFKEIVERKREKRVIFQIANQANNLNNRANNKIKLNLKNEFRTAILLIISINLLLLIINIIDINWIWFGFEYKGDFSLKQFVHEGTYLLILSILISMGIMIYYFRKNINFYPNSKFLKYLSYAWIFQNVILTISVIIRNYHYIYYFDLAYKRIGLFAFLILVLVGLFTLFQKIRNRKTGYYLFRVNTLAVYIVMVLMTLVNWDSVIAKYNMTSRNNEKIDTYFLLRLTDNTLPILDEYQYVLDKNQEYISRKHIHNQKIQDFIMDYRNRGWQSWNIADYKAYNYLLNRPYKVDSIN